MRNHKLDTLTTEEELLLRELPAFESFLNRVGFKRIDGAVYGLLVLSERPLSSEEIKKYLGLSQSAISNSLNGLTHFGALECREHPDNNRVKLHFAKEDSLSIVSSIFRKREQQHIEEFKAMALRLLKASESINAQESNTRNKRLKSIIMTCELAESVMKFVIGITQSGLADHYSQVLGKLPKTLDLLIKGSLPIAGWAGQFSENLKGQVKSTLTNTFKKKLQKLNEPRENT